MTTTIVGTPSGSASTSTATPGVAATLAIGTLGGFSLGVVARAWMRLISDDPDFSWSGTIFIVGAFTVFGATQSIAAATRPRARHGWTLRVARAIAIVGMLPLFVGAGMIMLPTVVFGGLAAIRTDWPRGVRSGFAAFAAIPVAFVTWEVWRDFGASPRTVVGIAGLLAIYGVVVWATRFGLAAQPGRRLPRWALVSVLVAIGGFLGFSIFGMTGG